MTKWQILSLAYLVFVAGFLWGYSVERFQVFPHSSIEGLTEFLLDDTDNLDLSEKLMHDLNVTPSRLIYTYYNDHLDSLKRLTVPGLKGRREPPLIGLSPNAPRGYRVLFGAIDFEDNMWGGLVIDSTGAVAHHWELSTGHLQLEGEPDHRQHLYGVSLLTDGSVIYNLSEAGGGIVRVGYCGEIMWSLEGQFHHTATVTEGETTFWTFQGTDTQFDHVLVEADVSTGEVLRRIDMKDVRESNPNIDIFHLQKYKEDDMLQTPRNPVDNVHGNDIDPLPASLAQEFPGFQPGDLLLSFRVINQVSIIDPDTYEIKWWRIGAWGKQHDPDWNPGGFISVFDNNPGGFGRNSHIKSINPWTMKTEILVDGSDYGFFSTKRGRHELTSAGTILITSSYQGHVFEVDDKGAVVFEFVNVYGRNRGSVIVENLVMSDAFFLPSGFFGSVRKRCEEAI